MTPTDTPLKTSAESPKQISAATSRTMMASTGEMSSIPPKVGSRPRNGARMGSAMARISRTRG